MGVLDKIGGLFRTLGHNFDANAAGPLPTLLGKDFTPEMRHAARSNAIQALSASLASGGKYPIGPLLQGGQDRMLEQGMMARQLRQQAEARQELMTSLGGMGGGQPGPPAAGPGPGGPPAPPTPAGPPAPPAGPPAPPMATPGTGEEGGMPSGPGPSEPPPVPAYNPADDQELIARKALDPDGSFARAEGLDKTADLYTAKAQQLMARAAQLGNPMLKQQAKELFDTAKQYSEMADKIRPKPFGEQKWLRDASGREGLLTTYTNRGRSIDWNAKRPSDVQYIDTGNQQVPVDKNAANVPTLNKQLTPGEANENEKPNEFTMLRDMQSSDPETRDMAEGMFKNWIKGHQSRFSVNMMTPEQQNATAAAIANGDFAPQTVRAMLRRNPGLMSEVKKVDPQWDEADLESRYDTLKQFTNSSISKYGGQVTALNTLIHHGGLFQEVAQALKNGNFTPGNMVYNKVATLFGAAPPTRADLVARFLAGETAKVAIGGVPGEREVNGILGNLGQNAGPEQLDQAGKTIIQIAAGRAVPLREIRDKNRLQNRVDIIFPSARAILERQGFDPETLEPKAAAATVRYMSGGRPYNIPAGQAKAFLADHPDAKEAPLGR
jgi:hypothetical protein